MRIQIRVCCNFIYYQFTQLNGEGVDDSRSIDNLTENCVTYYCPGHLNKKTQQHSSRATKTITYLTFSPDGNELLVNMGSEQIYLYDLNNAEEPKVIYSPPPPPRKKAV